MLLPAEIVPERRETLRRNYINSRRSPEPRKYYRGVIIPSLDPVSESDFQILADSGSGFGPSKKAEPI